MSKEWGTQTRAVGFIGWNPVTVAKSETEARAEFERTSEAYKNNGYGEVKLLFRDISSWGEVGAHGNCWKAANSSNHDSQPWGNNTHTDDDDVKTVYVAVTMILALHRPLAKEWGGEMFCKECGQLYPCHTVQACEGTLQNIEEVLPVVERSQLQDDGSRQFNPAPLIGRDF